MNVGDLLHGLGPSLTGLMAFQFPAFFKQVRLGGGQLRDSPADHTARVREDGDDAKPNPTERTDENGKRD